MYYESVITLIDKLTKMLSDVAKKFKQTKFESAEMTLRKTVDATGTSGRNLADVFGIYDYPTLFRTIQSYARQRKWEYFEIGDYIIIPNININGANYANIRFILTGINSYDGIGNAGSYIPGLVFSAYNVLYNDTWLNVCDNDNIINNAGQFISNSIGQNLNSAWHYNSQRRQAFWKSNSAFILSEQELSNPMRSYTIGNTHSNHILPLYKRSSLSKYRYNLSNNPSPFWLSNKDQYNSLYLEAVYVTKLAEVWHSGGIILQYNHSSGMLIQVRDTLGYHHGGLRIFESHGAIIGYRQDYNISILYPGDSYYASQYNPGIHNTDYSNPVLTANNGIRVSTQHVIILIHANNDWGSIIGLWDGYLGNVNGIDYEFAYTTVFDHYNYHYEMGALYQEINKLPSSTLNNTSSGVTFSIYA